MVDALSLSGNGTRVAGLRPAAPTRPVAAAPAVPPVPATTPAPEADAVEAAGDLDFLYTPGGRPDGGGQIAATSGRLDALLASLMQPSSPAAATEAAPAAQQDAPSVVTQLYNQF